MTEPIGMPNTGYGVPARPLGEQAAIDNARFDKTHISQAKAQSLHDQSRKAARDMLNILSKGAPSPGSSLQEANGSPELKEPRVPVSTETRLDSNARFTQLAGAAMALLGNVSLSQLAGRLEITVANSEALRQYNETLFQQFQQAAGQGAAAAAQAEADMESLQIAQQAVVDKLLSYQQALTVFSQLTPTSPGYAAAESELAAAEGELTKARELSAQAETKASQSFDAAREAILASDELFKKLENLANVQQQGVKQAGEQNLNAIARMMLLIGTFIKLVGENSEKALESDAALFERLQETRQKEMQKQAKEYAAEVRKADELNKAMGCVGKILGGLITALSVVGAVFSGGASLAFAAVGLALLVGDAIGKAVSGVSFMEKALNPIMENIIKPLVDALSKGLTQMLERLGVDSNTANMIGGVVGTLLAAALIIAVVVVGKAAASKVASTAFGSMVNEAIKKLLPNILKDVAAKSGAMTSNGIKRLLDKLSVRSDSAALQNYTNRLYTINNSMMLGSATVQAGGGVARGIYEKNAQDILASFTLSAAVMEQLKRLLELMVEKYHDTQSAQQQQWARLIETQSNALQTSNAIVKNTFA